MGENNDKQGQAIMADKTQANILLPIPKAMDLVSPPTIIGLVKDLGFPIVVAAYFLFKDYMFTDKLIHVQAQTNALLQQIIYHVQK